MMQVTIPNGLRAGQEFHMMVPAPAPPMGQPAYGQPTGQPMGDMAFAPHAQVMKRELQPSSGPKPLVQSQEEAEAFGQRFWAQYLEGNARRSLDGEIFVKPEKMYSLMRKGADGSPAPVRLLRLSWLLKQARRGAVLPRRQEMPEEAFLSEAEVRALPRGHVGMLCESCTSSNWPDESPYLFSVFSRGRAERPLRIISISHGWLTPEHPDPFGQQLKRFVKQIKTEQACCVCSSQCCNFHVANCLTCGFVTGCCCFVIPCMGQQCGDTAQQLPSGEFGVFYDYGSLHQKDADGQRTESEQAAFKTALETMGMWYAHRLTTTVILSELPPGWPKSAKDAPFFPKDWLRGKGWPSFERAVSGLLKPHPLSGMSFRRLVDPAVPRSGQVGHNGSYRAPPMHPREFAADLSRKVFSNGADCEVVARLYADTFLAALGDARTLEFAGLEWKDADAQAFSKVLPLLRRAKAIDLTRNMIGESGFAALAAAIRAGGAPALQVFICGMQFDPKQNVLGQNDPKMPLPWMEDPDMIALRLACEARGIVFVDEMQISPGTPSYKGSIPDVGSLVSVQM